MRVKLIIAGIILSASLGYLALAGIKKGWVYFLEVDQFLADETFHGQRVRLHGEVAEEGLSVSPGLLTASFTLRGELGSVPVVYSGVIPDQFMAGRDVVVEGMLDDARVFQANVLMTKCASKYEPASPHGERE